MQQSPDAFSESVAACLSVGPSSHANICIKDTLDVSGNFLNQILLRMAIQAGHRVLLVPVEQSFEKYKFALKKMGVNLQQSVDEGQVAVVSPASVLARQQQCQQQQHQQPQQEQREGESQGPMASPLRRLHANMARALDQLASWTPSVWRESAAAADHTQHAGFGEPDQNVQEGPVSAACSLTVIIDGLSELSILATSMQDWLSFLHYCIHLGASHQTHAAMNRVLRCHVDESLLEEDGGWIRLLEHASQLVLSVKPLEGHIADLDGQVIFSYRHPPVPVAVRLAAASAAKGESHATGAALPLASAVALVPEQAFVPTSSMYFRGGETGVRWMPQITGKDLLWQ